MTWRKFLIVPRLAALAARAPRDQARAWDRFWSSVRRTGEGGDVLWDLGSRAEMDAAIAQIRAHADAALPIVDAGCGNGRYTRALAAMSPRALGLDVSAAAVGRARAESEGVANASFRVADMTQPGAGRALLREIGPANVYVRGVLHVLDHEGRLRFVDNVRDLLGDRGAAYVIESDFQGDSLDHLEFQGATAATIPEPLRLCLAAGVRAPAHFSAREFDAYFPAARWDRLAEGSAALHTLPMHNRGRAQRDDLAAYFAVLRPRP